MASCNDCQGEAVIGYGSTVEAFDPSGSEWVLICGITNFNGPTSSRGEIDVTTLCSPAKEYILDLKDWGTIEMSGNLLDGNKGQRLLDTLFNSAEKTQFRLTLIDDGYGGGVVVRTFEARVSAQPITIAQGAANQISFTLRITGDVVTTRPDAQGPTLSFSPAVLAESADNNGSVAGVVVLTLTGDTFLSPVAGVTFSGTPDGLTANATYLNPNTMVISFSGTATDNDAGTKAVVGVTFADAAFTGGDAAAIVGSSGRQITINFV